MLRPWLIKETLICVYVRSLTFIHKLLMKRILKFDDNGLSQYQSRNWSDTKSRSRRGVKDVDRGLSTYQF